MDKSLIQLKYYETYYCANIVNNVILDPLPFLVNLEGFWGDQGVFQFFEPFPKHSAFHSFAEYVIDDLVSENQNHFNYEKRLNNKKFYDSGWANKEEYMRTPIENALVHYNIEHESFSEFLKQAGTNFDNAGEEYVDEYYSMLRSSGIAFELFECLANEVFHIMFLNRTILKRFNSLLAEMIRQIDLHELPQEFQTSFKKNGVLNRVAIPEWAKRAVFHRDKGKCVLCNKDISGILSNQNALNYDHIVPLALGGINDITNLQLLCRECNFQKKHLSSKTSDKYEKWF